MPQSTASLEFRIMVTALKPHVSAEEVAWLAEALAECDQVVLEQQLRQEGLLPPFAARLLQLEISPLPEPLATHLRDGLDLNTRQNLLLVRELFAIIDAAASRGIAVVPFKGPVFAFQCYGSPGLRTCNDLDVLIRIEDLQGLKPIFEERGYDRLIELTPAEERIHLRSECEFNFTHPREGTLVEAHWLFMPPYYTVRDLPGLWDDLVTIEMGGRALRVMSPEHCLLALVQHGSKHSWENTGLALDIAKWIDVSPQLDFEKLFRIAERAHMRRMLVLSLHVARELLDLPLPEFAMTHLAAEPGLRAQARQLVQSINRPEKYTRDLTAFAFIFHLLDGWSDRLKFVTRFALMPSVVDVLWARLPGPLTFLYPFFRLLRLSQMFFRQITGRLLPHRTVNA